MRFFYKIWEHKIFFSVALSETAAVRGLHIRAFWPVFACILIASTWLGLLVVGENARARLAARMAGDAQTTAYLDKIAKLEEEKEAQSRQVSLIAQELGILQARLDRFDVIGEKLGSDEELGKLIGANEIPGGQGGPEELEFLEVPSLEELQKQLGIIQRDADRAQVALETGLALSISKQEMHAGIPHHFPVVHPHAYISSSYGSRKHPITKKRHWHGGLDVAAGWGAPIVSAADGVVVYAGYRYAYGIFVEIRHANGFSTRYAHLKKATATNGQQVKAGELVGLMGSTGRSTGPHLHFEVLKNDESLNPYTFVKGHMKTARKMGRDGIGERQVEKWKEQQKLAQK
ncbi:MAG: M23 family metallopeptidase [Alphaproteobacteria bacterium]|nr:M23 family metallopeptidase [Alphaproteobacteria bacterium]MDD9919537.1 M23 family metallopeptidase [Alphaproteobacteria bacterium]